MVLYDNYYKTKNLFGEAYQELVDFFKNYNPKGKVIDLGCGQGRNSIALAKLGFKVLGIDNSKVGINQLIETSKKEGVTLTGIISDVYTFDNFQDFDVVLLDSMFHFDKQNKNQEINLILKITKQIKKSSVICICIQDTGQKVKILKDTIANSGVDFKVLNDTSLVYHFEDKKSGHKVDTDYCFYVIKKK